MKKLIILSLSVFIFFINCKSQKIKFNNYIPLKGENITSKHSKCGEIMELHDNVPFNGKYKVIYDNNISYGTYKNGNAIGFYYYTGSGNKLIVKKLFDNNGKLIEYTHYQNINEKKKYYDDNLSYSRYDSVKTYISKDMPYKTIFYDKNNIKNINYSIEPGIIKLKTDINDFTFRHDDMGLSWISQFIFSKCSNNKFIFNSHLRTYYDNVKVIIFDKKEKVYNYKLSTNDDGSSFYEEEL